uniref:Serine protease K12H4.7 n=1 Tax=Panagrellus redivivus TaxID=6233 RepID=A0A7E4UZ86_PANRE
MNVFQSALCFDKKIGKLKLSPVYVIMGLKVGAFCLLVLLVAGIAARVPRPSHIPRHVWGRPFHGLLSPLEDATNSQCDTTYEEGNFTQPLDHFNSSITDTWQQYYQYNTNYATPGSNIVFFMLGGESPIGAKWICRSDYAYLQWAKKYGATVFQVEHRYFGRSRPKPTQTTENLKWFTPEQILADFDAFINAMNKDFFNGKQMKWVLFGGSYPGSLTAWMRAAYPNSSIAGISSSSAVGLFVDYYGYATNMQKNYKKQSAACGSSIEAGFKKIQTLSLSEAGRKQLQTIFNTCTDFPDSDSISPRDLQYFYSNVFGEFQGINQYSGDNRDPLTATWGLGVPKACDYLTDSSVTDEVQRVANVINWVNGLYGEPNACLPNNYTDYIVTYSDPKYDASGDIASGRSWTFQCCSYLGYFQTTDGGRDNGIWGSLIPVDFYVDQCIDMFGPEFKLDFTYAQVDKYLEKFGGAKHYKGTNVVFPNGSLDPWFSLGLIDGYQNETNNVFATTIDGGAHCSDMYPARPQDSASLTAARKLIADKLDYFINNA